MCEHVAGSDGRPTTLFHFVGGRRYLQCFAASSSAAKTRGIGRTRGRTIEGGGRVKRRRIFYNCSGGHIRHTRKPSVYLCESCGHAGIALHLKGKETIAECATEVQSDQGSMDGGQMDF